MSGSCLRKVVPYATNVNHGLTSSLVNANERVDRQSHRRAGIFAALAMTELSLRGAQRRSNPEPHRSLDRFAALAMTKSLFGQPLILIRMTVLWGNACSDSSSGSEHPAREARALPPRAPGRRICSAGTKHRQRSAMPSITTSLAALLSTVSRAGDFFVAGRIEIFAPRLEVDGVGPIALPLLPAQAGELVAAAERAPYGRGEETLVDTSVRRTW